MGWPLVRFGVGCSKEESSAQGSVREKSLKDMSGQTKGLFPPGE